MREEIDKIRRGEHGARSAKQVIAIGLSEARRAGVDLPPPKSGQTTERTRRSAEYAYEAGQGVHKTKRRPRVSRAVSKALKREPRGTASRKALSRQAQVPPPAARPRNARRQRARPRAPRVRRAFPPRRKRRADAGAAALEHDPEKSNPVFRKRSCSNKKLERDADPTITHPALLSRRGMIAERPIRPTTPSRLKPGKETASGLSLPLKRGWWGWSFRSVVSPFSAFGFMPIHEADPWRLQYFTHVETDVDITTEDSDAW